MPTALPFSPEVTLSQEEIVRRHQRNPSASDSQALLNKVFEDHYRRVFRWCHRFTGDREQARDLTQEVFLLAFRKLDTFRGDCKFSTWLYKIARNRCLNEKKECVYDDLQVAEATLKKVPDASTDPYRNLEERNRRELATRLLRSSLTDREASVMTLHFGQEVPLDAVSHLLDLRNASGARAFLVSAKRKLARAVQKEKYAPLTRLADLAAGGSRRSASAA